MEKVFEFVATFEEYPPRSFPPSFVPTKIMEQEKTKIKGKRALENYEKRMMPQFNDQPQTPKKSK
jgi:arylsulfatase